MVRDGAKNSRRSDDGLRLGGVLEFMRLIWAVDHGLQSTSKRMAATLGVTGMQRLVVRVVGRVPEISAGHIAEILHVDPSTLTGVLMRLCAHGYIARKGDPRDRRRACFSLTAKGRRINRETAGTIEAAVRRALGTLDRDQVDTARTVLRRLAGELARR